MKLTAEEKKRVVEDRARAAWKRKEQEKERKEWEAEQRRLDIPGLGCLTCEKTIRQVCQEGCFDNTGNNRLDSKGYVSIAQWTGGGFTREEGHTTRFTAPLCCSCLRKMVATFQRKVNGRAL